MKKRKISCEAANRLPSRRCLGHSSRPQRKRPRQERSQARQQILALLSIVQPMHTIPPCKRQKRTPAEAFTTMPLMTANKVVTSFRIPPPPTARSNTPGVLAV